jgi:hypothetical protein
MRGLSFPVVPVSLFAIPQGWQPPAVELDGGVSTM